MINQFENCTFYKDTAICEHLSNNLVDASARFTSFAPVTNVTVCDFHTCFWGVGDKITCNGVGFYVDRFLPWENFYFNAVSDHADVSSFNVWKDGVKRSEVHGLNIKMNGDYTRRYQTYISNIKNVTCDMFHTMIETYDGTTVTFGLPFDILAAFDCFILGFFLSFGVAFLTDTFIALNEAIWVVHFLLLPLTCLFIYIISTEFFGYIVFVRQIYYGAITGYLVGVLLSRFVINVVRYYKSISRVQTENEEEEQQEHQENVDKL